MNKLSKQIELECLLIKISGDKFMIRVYQGKEFKSFFKDWMESEEKEKNDKLRELFLNNFKNKCAFCETPLDINNMVIEHYRPIGGALNTYNGQFSYKHYNWLVNEWSNYLVICPECNRNKSNRFPIDGDFCSVYSDSVELNQEKRLLINPTRDFPEKHFTYDEDYMIIPRTLKGEITIALLNLNRHSLLDQRHKEMYIFNELCNIFKGNNENKELLKSITEQISPQSPFAGIKRYYLLKMIEDNLIPYFSEFDRFLPSSGEIIDKVESIKLLKSNYLRNIEYENTYSIENELDLPKYLSRQRYIESIEIQNFKGIRNIKIDLSLSKSKDAPWLMILGENGAGKSSILQAISIALMGHEKREEIIKKGANYFLNNKASHGFVRVQLSGMIEPIQIELDRENDKFIGINHTDPKVLILAYGSTRLLPNEDRLDDFYPSWARVENLFDPFQPLVDVESYLTWLKYGDFIKVKKAIENLFFEKVEVIRTEVNKEIKFEFPNSTVKLDDLSDGYKTIIALATDIMMVMKNRWRSYDAEGVVLIDELDAHLHPRWNIEIVKRLRKAFPKIQFIVTSHNPLTLRGLLDNEIAVITEDNNRENIVIQDLPAQKGMKVEEILTSKYFGLYDTLPELNIIFQEYYSLLIHPFPNDDQQKRINELEEALADYKKLGLTKRDQLFYKAIDIYLAKEKEENSQANIESLYLDIENIVGSLQKVYEK
ncbi:AAA family ATPase [Lysinibacillus sp. CTST325]